MFKPECEYTVHPRTINIKDFSDFAEDYVVRPPYQRKNVWSSKKQRALLDSLFRGYYIPCIVLREVRLGPQEVRKEVIDGQQRINTVQRFFANELTLPDTLKDVRSDLPGSSYSDLDVEIRRFVAKDLSFDVDYVMGIDDPNDPAHQKVATEIFRRLQEGESLTYMERAHGRLSSTARNFVVKYADDIGFDYDEYMPLDENPHKHEFFSMIDRNNNRMQHLALLTRFLIMEDEDGPADVKESDVEGFIDRHQAENGIGNVQDFEELPAAQEVIRNMRTFAKAFADDPMLDEDSGIKELRVEYFIISMYLLLRHLRKHYVLDNQCLAAFQRFVHQFHQRWRDRHEDDRDVLVFSDNRQQSRAEIETRHRVVRQLFFEFCDDKGVTIRAKDSQRVVSEADRIRVYRRDNGLCQICLANGRSEEEARVPWSDYDADHVLPHSKGGPTTVENMQVTHRECNLTKGNSLPGPDEE
jgi:5-methylcytosine-specific restriction endonuclease McrA